MSSNKHSRNHTLIKVKTYLKLSDFGVIDPFTGVVYDSLSLEFMAEGSRNIILLDSTTVEKNGFEEVLARYPELNLN